jgi:peptidylprolyl isomerase/FKBP-type peptidyl-prolyl cis-trans isomerase FklB
VKVTASGLQYKIVRANPAGAQARLGDEVRVNYEGTLIDGTVFDSSYAAGQPVIFPLDNLVPAWLEAIPMMHVGEEWLVFAPPALGYGEQARPSIPANSVLVFRIELLGILPAPTRALA